MFPLEVAEEKLEGDYTPIWSVQKKAGLIVNFLIFTR